MFRAIFLDRDGVLIENRAEYVRTWSDVEIYPKAVEALKDLRGYKVVVVTNQAGVGRGLMTLETAQTLNQRIVASFQEQGAQIDRAYLCPHAPDEQCSCRKPNPGMLLQAAQDLGLDLHRSWMIGDAWSDLLAGQAAGTHGLALLRTGRGNAQLLQEPPKSLGKYFVFNDLAEALHAIKSFDSEVST